MKLLIDLFPVILFFAAYWLKHDIFTATAVAIVASVIQVAYIKWKHGKVETMQWVSLALIVVMGGATLLLKDKHFIMWKPTLLYWAMAGGLLVGQLAGKNGMRALMGTQMELPDMAWKRLNYSWMGFFTLMGGLNLFVAYHFSEETWVNFKLFGGLGLMLVFVLLQGMFLSKYLQEENK